MSISFEAVSVTPQTVKTGEQFLLSTKIKAGYTNQVPISINPDGSIYNGTGYKNGYRIRSGGAEATSSGASCTGFIPVKPNDVVRVSGWNMKTTSGTGSNNAINIADVNFNNLGQWAANSEWGYGNLQGTSYAKNAYMVEESTGVYKWIVPPTDVGNIAYIRVSGHTGFGETGHLMIVTVNEEII